MDDQENLAEGKNDEDGKVTSTRKEDQGKGVGMGFMGVSPGFPCQGLESHLALFAWDDLLG